MPLEATQLPVILNLALSYDHQSYRHQFQIHTHTRREEEWGAEECHLKAIILNVTYPCESACRKA